MNYYVGVDIGTTSSKAVAFAENGEVLANFSIPYDMYHPQPGWCEQEPDEIFLAVISVLKKVLDKLTPHRPLFISFSAAMHSIIAIDENAKLLTKLIIWADNRSDTIAQKLRDSEVGQKFYCSTGVPIHCMSPLCKLLWLRQYQPDIFKAAYKFISIKEWIFYKLFKEFVVDTSIASATGLLNAITLKWDEDILHYLKIEPSSLSSVVSTKAVFYLNESSSDIALAQNIPFIIGASDGALSNLGTGAIESHSLAVTIGTSGAARMVVDEFKTDRKMRTFCYHLKDNLYIAGGANNNGAVVIQWLKEKVLQSNEDLDAFLDEAKLVPAGTNGLLFLPYLLGERAPIWNANAKAVYFGLTIQHTRAHMVRASLEGAIYSIFSIIQTLNTMHKVTELHASGGFAKSALWLQMLADISNLKVLVSDTVESSALGAVMLGAESLNITTNFKRINLTAYKPNPIHRGVYQKQFKRFEHLYELLKTEMISETY